MQVFSHKSFEKVDFGRYTRMKLRERNKESETNVVCRGRNRADGIGSKKQTERRHFETTTLRW